MKRNGFTLVEMMAVIALVGLLAVIGVATYTRVNESAKQKILESKKEEIRSSAIKWAKENNITNKTIISVNALVVEGYLTADENRVGEIGSIENPVTGENMICNTVDISFKEGEPVAEVNDTVQNCDLATQSLVDTKINIQVIDADGHNKTGGTNGSISNWTNKNVMIVVSSSDYDRDAVSISFDFEGNTETKQVSGLNKYTGTGYLNSDQVKLYYNVFNIDANLLLSTKVVVTYTLTNGTTKSRAYTIRIDKEEATATVKSNNEWLTTDKPIYVLVDDGKGSGPRYFYVTTRDNAVDMNNSNKYDANNFEGTATNLEVGKYFIWTEDNAGNRSVKPKMILEVNNVDKTVPECEVLFDGHVGNNGWYKEVPVGVYAKNSIPAGISGFNIGVNDNTDIPVYSTFAYYNTYSETQKITRDTETTRAGYDYYCHVKTLAGNYANNSKNLKLDMTPPTVTIDITSDTNYTQKKMITPTVTDNLSGIPNETKIRYRWVRSDGESSNWYYNIVINPTPGSTGSLNISSFHTPYDLTGIYTLQVDVSEIVDYAGNHATGVNGGGTASLTEFGPFYFDNTPPRCSSNNGKESWTKNGYTINQLCADDDGTEDQSGCVKKTYTIKYLDTQTVKYDSVVIADKVGNETTCNYGVFIDNTPPYCGLNNGKTNWTTGEEKITQNCEEDESTQSGCESSAYTSTWNGAVDVAEATITIKDKVGNYRPCTVNVYLDNIAPVCSFSYVGSQVVLNYTENHVKTQGLSTAYSNPNGALSAGMAHNTTYYGLVRDLAGNECNISVKIRKTIDRYTKKSKYCNREVVSWEQTAKKCNYNGKTQKWKTCERKDDGEGGYDYYWSYSTKTGQSRCFESVAFDCTSNHYQDGDNYECYDAYGLGSGTTTTVNTCNSSSWSCGSGHVNETHYDCSPNYTYHFDPEVTSDVTKCTAKKVSKCNSSNYNNSNVTCDKYIGCESGYTKINNNYCHN